MQQINHYYSSLLGEVKVEPSVSDTISEKKNSIFFNEAKN